MELTEEQVCHRVHLLLNLCETIKEQCVNYIVFHVLTLLYVLCSLITSFLGALKISVSTIVYPLQ